VTHPTTLHPLQKELYSLLNRSVFEFLDNGSLDGILYWDLTQKQNLWISPRFWQCLGYREEEMEHLHKEWKHVMFEEDFNTAMEKLNQNIQHPQYPFNRVIRYRHKGGKSIWLRMRAMVIRNKQNRPIRVIMVHNNVSADSQKENTIQKYKDEITTLRQELAQQSIHDYLTKIYNRKGLEQKYKYLIEISKRDGSYLSVAMFDIDNFSQINEEHGRPRGDKILKEIATTLIDSTRRVDVIGRFDDEEFVLLMPNTAKEDATMVCDRIRKHIDIYPIGGINDVTVSCGIATVNASLEDDTQRIYDTVNLCIDEALYYAKKRGRNQVLHYDDIQNSLYTQTDIEITKHDPTLPRDFDL